MRLENRYSLNMLCWYLHVLLLLNLYFLGVGRLYGGCQSAPPDADTLICVH
jgi:hypothetical protein